MQAAGNSFLSPLFSVFSKTSPQQAVEGPVMSLSAWEDELRKIPLNEWISKKSGIRRSVNHFSADLDSLNAFLKALTKMGISQDIEKTKLLFSEIINVELLEKVIQKKDKHFSNVAEWCGDRAPFCPQIVSYSIQSYLSAEWKKCSHLIIHFIPNVMNILLGLFNLLNAKKYSPFYEQYLRFEILCKVLLIPYALVQGLSSILGISAKVYLISALIITATGLLLNAYQRWFKPIPDKISNCQNLDKKMENGFVGAKVGQTKEIQQLIGLLESDANIVLIGPSGEGKTALFHHFMQHKYEGKLSDNLSKLRVFGVDCGLMISSVNYGHSELINQIKDEIENYEKDILLVFDEFYQIATNPAAFQAFKNRFLEELPKPKFIAMMTYEEFEQIKKLDIGNTFRRRISFIHVDSSSDSQTRFIAEDFLHQEARNIPIAGDALDGILEISNKDDYMPGIGKPAKVIKILKEAIQLCRNSYHSNYTSLQLIEEEGKLQSLKSKAIFEEVIQEKTWEEICENRKRIQQLKTESESLRKEVGKIKNLIQEKGSLRDEYYRLTHQFAHMTESNKATSKNLMENNLQIQYLWAYFYGLEAIKDHLQAEMDKINEQIPLQIDKKLILKIYENLKKVELNVYAKK